MRRRGSGQQRAHVATGGGMSRRHFRRRWCRRPKGDRFEEFNESRFLLLDQFGITVRAAPDGQQALAALMQGAQVDLIFMDLQMPVLDGYAATEQIRQWEAQTGRSRCPIIAQSADAFAPDRQRCLDVGMDDFLAKPIDIALLRALLERWLP